MSTTFPVTFTGTFFRNEIPPRCRKPRDVSYPASATVNVPVVSSAEAPVAFRVHQPFRDNHPVNEIRLFNGQLYAMKGSDSGHFTPVTAGSDKFPAEVNAAHHLRSARSEQEFKDRARESLDGTLILDDVVWTRVGEPRYVVNTYGLGGNHGGTGLSDTTYDNLNIRAEAYFRADEFELARAYAINVATERGDTESARSFTDHPERYATIEVIIMDAVRLVTVDPVPEEINELRYEYTSTLRELRDAENPVDESTTFARLVKTRARLLDQGYSPVNVTARPYEDR